MKTLDSLTLADITTHRVLGVGGDCPIVVAARRMGETRVSCLAVMDGDVPCGIITERDLVKLLYRRTVSSTPVADLMRVPVITAPSTLDFRSAYALLRRHGIRHLIAVDPDGTLAGVATTTDFRLHLGLDKPLELEGLSSLLNSATAILSRDATLTDALERMIHEPWDYVLVADHDKPIGILTERDIPLLFAAEVDPREVKLNEVMSTPVHSINAAATPTEAFARLAKLRIRHMAVVGNDHRLVGMITQDGLMERLGIEILEGQPVALPGPSAWPADTVLRVLGATCSGMLLYDAETDRICISRELTNLLGYPTDWQPEGLAGWSTMIHPADHEGVPDELRLRRGAADDRVHQGQLRLLQACGDWMTFQIRSRVTRHDKRGNSLEVVATLAASTD